MATLSIQQMPHGSECFDGKKTELGWEDSREMTKKPGDGNIGCPPSQDLNASFNSLDGSVSDVSLGVIPARNISVLQPDGIGSTADRMEFAKVEEDLIHSEECGDDSTLELTDGGLVQLNNNNNNISLPNPEEVEAAAVCGEFNNHPQPTLQVCDSESCWSDMEESAGSIHNVEIKAHNGGLHDVDPNRFAAEARPLLAMQPHDEHLQGTNVMVCVDDENQSVYISDTMAFHDDSEWGSVGDNETPISNEKCANTPVPSAAAASQHSPPPSSSFLNTSDGKVSPPPQSDLVRRALHGLPQQRKQRQQDHIRGLKSQAIKKTVFSHRAIAEHLAELERENAAVAKESERVRCIRRAQEAELSSIKHQKVSVKQWVEAEREITNRWCEEQKSRTAKECKQAIRQAHLSRARLRAGTLAMGEDKKEIDRLNAELEVQREKMKELQKKSKNTERRLQQKITFLEESLRESEEQMFHLERQRVELLMNGFDATRQKHRFPGHHTTTCTLNPPSKGYIKGKDGDERVIVDGCEIMKGNDITSVDEKSKKQTIRNATGASSQDDDDTGIKLKPEDNTAAKLSIQSQSGPQPPKGTHGITCKPAEAKKDVNDKSGRIAMSKAEAEVGHLLLPSKQAAYGDRENDRDEPKLEKTTVSPNIYQAEAITSLAPSVSVYDPHRYRWLSTCGEAKESSSPIPKEVTHQQDGIIVVKVAQGNKCPHEYFEDKQSWVQFANGTRKKTLACGKNCKVIVYYANGDSRITEVDGIVVYHYAESSIMQTTFPDGHKLVEFPSGQKEEHFIDGTKNVQFSDGSTAMIGFDGAIGSVPL